MNKRVRQSIVAASAGLVLCGIVGSGFVAYEAYRRSRPAKLTIENRTDHFVAISVTTVYRIDVAPHMTATLDTGWFPFTHSVFDVTGGAPFKQCAWSERDRPRLVVDDDGAHCHDVRADSYPFPTPVPPEPTTERSGEYRTTATPRRAAFARCPQRLAREDPAADA